MEFLTAGLISLIVLLLLDAFLSASQADLINARRHVLRDLADEGDRQARYALDIAEDSTRVLSTFQLVTLLIHFLSASVVALLLSVPDARWLVSIVPGLNSSLQLLIIYVIGVPLIALMIYVVFEALPAAFAQRSAEEWAIALARPAGFVLVVMSPLAGMVSHLRRGITSSRDDGVDGSLVTEEEIMTLVDAGEEEGAIEQEEKEMIYSIFQLDETLAREIMLPRIDIAALDIETPVEQAIEMILKAGHSRIPLYEESLDHIVGLLYTKDLVTLWATDRAMKTVSLRSLMRKVYFVPETKKVLDLLRELQDAKVHMAIVIDEYGGTAGLVTIEDIIEEIVGEIHDEYDFGEEAPYELIGDNEYIVDARMNLDDLNRLLDINLPTDRTDTLGGLVYEQLGKVPSLGERIKTERLTLEVLTVDGKRIGKVKVKRVMPSEQ